MGRSPNVFILSADSLGYYAFQEFSEKIAELIEGVEFTQAISTASETNSAMPSLAAGIYPSTVPGWGLPDEPPTTLLEALSNTGYSCGLWSDNYLFGTAYNYDLGVEAGNQGKASRKKRIANLVRKIPSDRLWTAAEWAYFNVISRFEGSIRDDESFYQTAQDLHEDALDWLESSSSRPVSCWIHYMDSHHPYEPPVDYLQRGEFNRSRKRSELAQLTRDVVKSNGDDASKADVEDTKTAYLASCQYLADEIIKFINQLNSSGYFDPNRDIMIITADHGECLDPVSFDMMGHNPPAFWEDIVHVPLIIQRPDWKHRTIDEQVSLIDLMPTVLQGADIPIPDTVEGHAAEKPGELVRSSVFFESKHRPEGAPTMQTYRGIRRDPGRKIFGARLNDRDTYVRTQFNGEETIEFIGHTEPTNDSVWDELIGELEETRGKPIDTGEDLEPDRAVEDHLRDLGYVE